MPFLQLPPIPAPHAELPGYLAQHPDRPMTELFEPYRKYEASVRELYAQEPGHPALADPHVNVLPLFTENTPKLQIRARDPAAEPDEARAKYIMPLPKENRRPNGAAAVVPSIKEFQGNFSVFSESSLADIGWDNVVAAGSSVVNCLLPVPEEYSKSRRSLREYYHYKFCPASDVDLFLYGLTEEQAVKKIKEIETSIRDSILAETTTVRTKHAVTICSEYPTRHVQIVLRIYKSVSEILAGFDIDSSGAAYDGKQVYCTPRALQSYMTQINHIDLTRRSPSYENRLSKYSHRNFEVYWNGLDRSRVDPTIFERSFKRTLGLARLLVLERLPTADSRQTYAAKRREERGRPPLYNPYNTGSGFSGNIKDQHEDEVAEWISPDDINNYDTFVLPYGRKYHAKRIEKLCYTRDLLLNAEWNQKKDREVYLHRHPAFFGRAEDVMEDCCGFCPKPTTDKEKEVAEEESKIYISGKVSFLTDDPGRQQIGSFNPLTDDDWTEMAYVGNTARLCQAIVDGDLEHVEDWLAQDGVDPNRRDHTGRTPLHLAAMTSTPAIVKQLVDNGARLIARVADGRTALHLAAQRGDADIVKILMDKSTENEAEEAEKEEQRRKAKLLAQEERKRKKAEVSDGEESDEEEDADESDGELVDDDISDDGVHSTTTASFVKVKGKDKQDFGADAALNENEEEPDFYDVNVVAWDRPCSALHFAIIEGHDNVVKLLCQEYGADVLLPVKLLNTYNNEPSAALLTLALALALPVEKAKTMASTLLSLGATCSQADLNGITAFHRYVETSEVDLVQLLLDLDKTGSSVALKNISFPSQSQVTSPLLVAISSGDVQMVLKLLDSGAAPQIDFDTWLKSAKVSPALGKSLNTFENNNNLFKSLMEQPLIMALQSPNPNIALELLNRGADPDTETRETHQYRRYSRNSRSPVNALKITREYLTVLRAYKGEVPNEPKRYKLVEMADAFLAKLSKESWMYVAALRDLDEAEKIRARQTKEYENALESIRTLGGVDEKKAAIAEMIRTLETIEAKVLSTTRETQAVKTEETKVNTYRGAEVTKNYEFAPQFTGAPDTTETRRKAYVELFEAAWSGDLDTIKKLTLAAWGDNKDQPPLAIAVSEPQGSNVFSLAFLRGHLKVAAAVLEIAQAQYAPEDKPNTRYEITGDDVDMDVESAYDSDEDGGQMYRIIVDNDQYTIDNIGEVNMQVKGTVKPLELLDWPTSTFTMQDGKVENYKANGGSLFNFVFGQNDPRGLKFLLDTTVHFANKKSDDKGPGFYTFNTDDFKRAVASGRVEMLAEVIKRTGAGLPLEEMVKDSGIEMQEEPEYYQGLTVYGKKRSDWAEAGRRTITRSSGMTDSPLLYAASMGSLESVEWFLSDAPLRCYLEFTASKAAQGDARLAHLGQAPGGFEGAISRWLTKNSDLALLKTISCHEIKKVLPIAKYLVKTAPESITAKDKDGLTPLMLATQLGRLETVKLLIDNGVDQTKRHEFTYANLLHAALFYNPKAAQIQALLDLLDADAVAHMFCERTHHASWSESRTPLHAWLRTCIAFESNGQYGIRRDYDDVDQMLAVLRILLTRSGGRELSVIDSAGDTVLHMLARRQNDPAILKTILECIPMERASTLLRRENATGATPLEVAKDKFLAALITEPQGRYMYHGSTFVNNWPGMPAQEFVVSTKNGKTEQPVPKRIASSKTDSLYRAEKTLALLSGFLESAPGKRQLVSLNECNDVARRVGHGFQAQRYPVQVVKPTAALGEQNGTPAHLDPMKLAFNIYMPGPSAWKWDEDVEEKHFVFGTHGNRWV